MTLEKFREKKDGILDDMRSFITYQPSRDNDLLAFMGQYQKADTAHRPAILEHLRSCMDGEKYPNPYAGSYQYTPKDVEQCEQILENYLDRLPDCRCDGSKISDCVQQTTCEINAINERCGGALIDSWRRERLCSFLNDAAAEAGAEIAEDLTLQHRMW